MRRMTGDGMEETLEEGGEGRGREHGMTGMAGEEGGREGIKMLGRDFKLKDETIARRKPLRGRRKGKIKQEEMNRVKEKSEKQGFIGSWAKAASSKDTSVRD